MDSLSRRRLLESIGVSNGMLITGCLGAPLASTETPSSRSEPTSTAGTDAESEYPTREGIQLGQADVEIHPQNTISFTDDVAQLRCTCVAAEAVQAHVFDQIDPTGISVGCGRTPILATPIEDTGFAVNVHHTTTYDREGNLLKEPAVSYDRLRAVTPRTASATIESEDSEHICTVPVYVLREEGHAD